MTAAILSSVIFMTAAIVLRKIFGKRLNGRLLMLMWALVFIKLAVPVNIPSAVSVMNLFEEKTENTAVLETEGTIILPSNQPQNIELPSEPVPEKPSENNYAPTAPKSKIDIKKITYSVYFTVSFFLEISVLGAYIICAIKFSKLDGISINEKFSEKNIRFKKSSLDTPAVFGIFRPIILIPENTDMTDEETLEYIILHEKTHIHHCDQLFNLLTLLICCINWYDPLAWICRALYLKDVEKWCDESVIDTVGNENRKSYAAALLTCASKHSHPLVLISGFGESDIKVRIKAISENKRLRRGVSAVAATVIIIIAAVLGTGKSVNAEMIYSGFVPTVNGWDYTQKFSGNNGEAAAVTLNLSNNYGNGDFNPDNYFRFTIGIDSDEYSISEPYAEMKISDVKSFRVLPDGEKNDNNSIITYNSDFDKKTNDIELAITFNNTPASVITADISYKLKKGIFTVGTYSMAVSYDLRTIEAGSFANRIRTINYYFANTGFEAKMTDKGYEISSTDGVTDMCIFFTDFDEGAIISDSSGRELKLEHFDPDYSRIFPVDVTNDGVTDLVITEYIRGTGVIDNYCRIIDGKNLCEAAVDDESIKQIITDFVNSSEFREYAAGNNAPVTINCSFYDNIIPQKPGIGDTAADEFFSGSDPHLSGQLFWDKENGSNVYLTDNIEIYGGIIIDTDGERLTGNTLFGLVRNETEYSDVFSANTVFKYRDGIFKAENIRFENN